MRRWVRSRGLFFEVVDVLEGNAGSDGVPLHVEFGCGEDLGERVAFIECGGLFDLGYEVGGHGCAGFVVEGEVREDLGVGGPVLVELGGGIRRSREGTEGAGEAGVFGVGEDAVEAVSELVEHGGDVVEGDERGLAGGGLGEVGDVVDDGELVEERGLIDEVAHPGAALFVVALEVVEVDEVRGVCRRRRRPRRA